MTFSQFCCLECGEQHELSAAEAEGRALIPTNRPCPNMTTYRFYWRHREPEMLRGKDPLHALKRAGYGRGDLAALDHYALESD